jgi:hypothetical protein
MLDVVLVTLLLLSRRVVVDLPGGRAVRLLSSGDRARGCLPALGPAPVVSAAWHFAMPAMTVIHVHIGPPLLFLTYLLCVLILVLCVRRGLAGVVATQAERPPGRETRPADAAAPA